MPSYIAAFALQQLRDMEELQRDSRGARGRRRRHAHRDLQASAPVLQATESWTLPHQTRRTPGVSPSATGATGTGTVS